MFTNVRYLNNKYLSALMKKKKNPQIHIMTYISYFIEMTHGLPLWKINCLTKIIKGLMINMIYFQNLWISIEPHKNNCILVLVYKSNLYYYIF